MTAAFENHAERDFTRRVKYSAAPAGIVAVDESGLVTAVADGTATITATSDGVSTSLAVKVEKSGIVEPINFPNQIVPIFTKAGCNSGGCHGKASGQNGFKLSLLGFEPAEDYEHLVKEARGRRIFPASPENSLLLLKGFGVTPHGGGKRLEPNSDEHRLLVSWIAQGMPYGKETDPVIASVEVLPKKRTMTLNGEQQLVVLARYSDGSMQDVTRSALYEPNDKSMAKAEEDGRVTMFDQPGDVGVMVRYQGKVAVFHATAPLGVTVENLPKPTNFIDELVFAKLKTIGMPPSPLCDDATFIRRASLDIAGRIPTLEETRRFVADADPKKRDKFIDSLLASAEYADFFAGKWSALLRNKRTKPAEARGTFAFHAWIRDAMLSNKPYDQFVREVVAASGEIEENPPVAWYRQVKDSQQQLEDTAQLFLGMRLQCAQCHHHPYEKWSQQDYYSFSAFFSQVGRKATTTKENEMIFHKRGAATAVNKKTKQPVKPAGLGAVPQEISPEDDPRLVLADWMSNKDNPFFAKALVNRYWKHFFNRGIVEPEDDMRETNPPSNPELLDALAKRFVESGYDMKDLIREMTRSQTYQFSALPNEFNKNDRQNFSRYYPRRLPAEVLFDALNHLTNIPSSFPGLPAGQACDFAPGQQLQREFVFPRRVWKARVIERLRMRAHAGSQPRAVPASAECQGHPGQAFVRHGPLRATRRGPAQRRGKTARTLPARLLPRAGFRGDFPRAGASGKAAQRRRRQAARSAAGEARWLRGCPLGDPQHEGIPFQSLGRGDRTCSPASVSCHEPPSLFVSRRMCLHRGLRFGKFCRAARGRADDGHAAGWEDRWRSRSHRRRDGSGRGERAPFFASRNHRDAEGAESFSRQNRAGGSGGNFRRSRDRAPRCFQSPHICRGGTSGNHAHQGARQGRGGGRTAGLGAFSMGTRRQPSKTGSGFPRRRASAS